MKYKKIRNKFSKKSFKKDLIHYYPRKAELRGTSTWKCRGPQPWALCVVDCNPKHGVLPASEWERELWEFPCYFQLNLISICGSLYKSRRVNHDLVSSYTPCSTVFWNTKNRSKQPGQDLTHEATVQVLCSLVGQILSAGGESEAPSGDWGSASVLDESTLGNWGHARGLLLEGTKAFRRYCYSRVEEDGSVLLPDLACFHVHTMDCFPRMN